MKIMMEKKEITFFKHLIKIVKIMVIRMKIIFKKIKIKIIIKVSITIMQFLMQINQMI